MTEIWRDIVGYEGLYEVSNLGRVRSLDRMVNAAYGSKQLKKRRILKSGLNRKGYQFVILCKNGKMKMYQIHRLVAQAFIPNPLQLPQVNHINECKTDNRVENLEYCDCRYNINFGTRNERIAKAKKGNPNIALSKRVMQIDANTNEVIKIWNSMQECQRHGFSQSAISQCCRNCYCGSNIYKGYRWQYVEDSI